MRRTNEALVAHSKSRTEEISNKLKKAMGVIEKEIEMNDGIYPFNGGRISLSEVCRRAGVHKITLQGASHKTTTKPFVEAWIAGIGKALLSGRKTVRKAVTARADDWKARYFDVARQLNEIYAIEVIAKQQALDIATSRISELEAEVNRLRAELSDGKIRPLRTLKKTD